MLTFGDAVKLTQNAIERRREKINRQAEIDFPNIILFIENKIIETAVNAGSFYVLLVWQLNAANLEIGYNKDKIIEHFIKAGFIVKYRPGSDPSNNSIHFDWFYL